MPELDFKITGVEPAAQGLVPLLAFKLEVANTPADEEIHAVILQVQIQIQSLQRLYSPEEKAMLRDLFGEPSQWGTSLRTRLWTLANTSLRPFRGRTTTDLVVPCSFDLNIAATKYFYALEQGDVPLLFLFSGTVFYGSDDGRLQVRQISWNKECTFRMPVTEWRELMDEHYPNTAWVTLHRDVLDRLYAYRREHGFVSWDQALESLLPVAEPMEVVS